MTLDPPLVPTLVVGGEHSLIVEKLAPQLLRHGLEIAAHWEWRKQAGAFPDSIRLVFVMTDMAGHKLNDAAVNTARGRGVPVVYGGRKWALNVERLAKAGFPERIPTVSTPDPSTVHPSESSDMPITDNPAYPFYKALVLADPELPNHVIFATVRANMEKAGLTFASNRGDIIAHVRREAGIRRPGQRARTPEQRAAAFGEPPVVIATVPTSEVPPEVLAAAPANVQRAAKVAGTTEIKDLVKLLRIVMAEENITHISVSPEGVTYRRVVVEEGALDA